MISYVVGFAFDAAENGCPDSKGAARLAKRLS